MTYQQQQENMPKEQHMLPLVALQLPEELLGRDHYVALLDDLIGNIEVSEAQSCEVPAGSHFVQR